MAGVAFRHLLSRWTVTSAMSEAAANNLHQGQRSWFRSSRRTYFGFFDESARAEAKRQLELGQLDHDTYMKLRELEQLRLDRTIRRLKSVYYFMAGIGLLFAGVYVSAPPSTHTTTTAPTTSSVEVQ